MGVSPFQNWRNALDCPPVRVWNGETHGTGRGDCGLHHFTQSQILNAGLIVFVQIRLTRTSQDIFERFKQAAVDIEEVQECYLISGNFDYLIKARVSDMDAYRHFLGTTLLQLPDVQESTSYAVMELVKETLNLPMPG